MFDPTLIGTWIGILIAAGGVIAGSIKFSFWVFDEWKKRKTHAGFSMSHDTLRLATKMPGNYWWHMGKRGDDPTMQIVGSVFATNVSSVPVRLPQVELRYGFLGRHCVSGMVMISNGARHEMYGMFDIPPGETRNVTFDFWVFPPVAKPEDDFTVNSVTIIDQFGNESSMKHVKFQSTVVNTQVKPKETEEFPYAITDPVAKEVVSVLKAERSRFQICGRNVGGLGSVHIVYRGHSLTGVGTDSWTSNSPLNQAIVCDPEAASLKSDNMDALTTLYRGLGSDEDRQRFRHILLERLDANKGYLDISYFIVLVLWAVGTLPEALLKAKQALPTGDTRAFGLSNVLMLLNGLLKYRHPDFTNAMLDDIEKMIHGLDEHPFLIPAKVAAIRAGRLSGAD
jgi:hypothetical protein